MIRKILAGVLLCAAVVGAQAQGWPRDRAVTMIVPFPPGGSTDTIARTLAARLPEKLGGTWVVQNTGGAGGTIGAAAAKRAAPDGYTVLVSSLGPFVIGPHITRGVQYDALKDFDYVSVVVQAPNVLAVPANSPFKTVNDVLADLRKNPGRMTFASAGNGTSDHLTAELFWQETGTKGTHVPYKGGAPAMQDLIAGQVDATFMNINTGVPQFKAGKLRPLAITSTTRSPLLPDVPTMEELGFKGVTVYSWQAVALPHGAPADARNKLNGAIVDIMKDPAVAKPLLDVGFEIVANSPQQFTEFQAREFARWKKVIQAGHITAE